MNTKMGKIVIFGGSGFVGSHVADNLSEKGFEVVIYDLKDSPYIRSGQTMIVGDVLDENKVDETLKDASYVYNFSGIADLDIASDNPQKSIENNIMGHTIILEKSRHHEIKRVVFASSVYVYSKHGSFYTICKQTCEHLCEEYQRKYNLDYTILRYGSLYGPRAQMWNGVYRYLYQAIKEGKIDYPGSGDEKRRYIHVFDAARLSADVLDEKYKNQCVIITGNVDLSSRDLLTMIREMLNNKTDVQFTNKEFFHHYTLTPYSFIPKMGIQLTPNPSVDMGEGLLGQIEEIYKKVNNENK